MLVDRDPLTPKQQAEILVRLFGSAAAPARDTPARGHVPLDVLEAYGNLNRHLRYLLTAALADSRRDLANTRRLRRLERELDALPDAVITTLASDHRHDWMSAYRLLLRLHSMLGSAGLKLDAEEYEALVGKMIELAARIADSAAVRVTAASMFSLLLIQSQLHEQDKRRERKHKRRKNRRRNNGARAAQADTAGDSRSDISAQAPGA